MPQWLKIYLLDAGPHSAGVKHQYRLDQDRQNLRYRNRDIGRDSRTDLPAIQLKNKQIDYSRANFITVDPPPSIPDMLSDPSKMYLVHLKSENDETIWSPGFSPAHEKFRLTNDKTISLNNLNNKTYRSLVQDVCYLDLNDTNNYKTNLQISRINAKKDVVDRDHSRGKEAERSLTGVAQNYIGQKYDKSGYLKPDLLKKYADLLRQRKFPKFNQKIKEVKEIIDRLVDANILEQYRNSKSNDFSRNEIRNAIKCFYNIVDYFESMVRILNDNTVSYDRLAPFIQDTYSNALAQYAQILSKGVVVSQELPADIDNSQIDDIDNWNDFM